MELCSILLVADVDIANEECSCEVCFPAMVVLNP